MKCLDFDWRIIEFMVYCLTYQFRKSMMASISNKKAPYHCGNGMGTNFVLFRYKDTVTAK